MKKNLHMHRSGITLFLIAFLLFFPVRCWSVTVHAADVPDHPPLTLNQYTNVLIDDDDEVPDHSPTGICTFTPATSGYYRIEYTSATKSASIVMTDSSDSVSNAIRENNKWTIYGVFKLEANAEYLFEIKAPYDSMDVLITKESADWLPNIQGTVLINLFESTNLYTGLQIPSSNTADNNYSVSTRNFPGNVASETIAVTSTGNCIELELVETAARSYYKLTGVQAGTDTLRISTTYCGVTKTTDVQVNVTDLILVPENVSDEMELHLGASITPRFSVYKRTGTPDNCTDTWTAEALDYVYYSEGAFQYNGQTVTALSVNDEGLYTAMYPGFGIMRIQAYKDGKLLAELGYNVVVRDANPFEDVALGEYYYNAVLWAAKRGVTTGATETTFEPAENCTRAQVVTFLWRAAGSPEPNSTACDFTDLDVNEYYYKPVLWAVEEGITTGATETTFEPDEKCTRAQVVTFLWRFASRPEPNSTACNFTDLDVNEYYYKPVLWAVEKGITTGATETTFEPAENCTRAQVVTFLWRFAGESTTFSTAS